MWIFLYLYLCMLFFAFSFVLPASSQSREIERERYFRRKVRTGLVMVSLSTHVTHAISTALWIHNSGLEALLYGRRRRRAGDYSNMLIPVIEEAIGCVYTILNQ